MIKIPDDEIQEVLLSVMVKIDEICRCNRLTYYLFGGTLIGAIRHKGFIPWDDDIDIAMPRDDYNKLMEIINSKYEGLKFISIDNNSEYINPYGKVYDTKTLLFEHDYMEIKDLGVYVDVFPIDEQGNKLSKARKLTRKMRLLNAFLFESNLKHYHRISKKWYCEIPKFFMYPVAKMLGTKYWVTKMNKLAQIYNGRNSKYVGCNVDPNYHTNFERKLFEKTIDVEFEGYQFLAPAGYDTILKRNYGNYMQLPPENKRVSHHKYEAFYK